jgi:hypothetical protein
MPQNRKAAAIVNGCHTAKRQPGHDLIGKLCGAGHGEHDDQQSRRDPASLVEKLP